MRPSLALLILITTAALAAEPFTPAFPGVEGAGKSTSGGRGGSLYRVTNLNAEGPGSLADAVSQPNRIVVFDVSGIIDLSPDRGGKGNQKAGKIIVGHPNITIAGQTAPGEGICIKGGTLQISASNVIVRHLRSRRGWNVEGDTGDAIEVKPVSLGERAAPTGQTQEAFDKRKAKKEERGKIIHDFAELSRIVIDHCSTSWATDENLTCTHADLTTLSWSIAAEGCDYANPKQTPPHHSEGSLWGSEAPGGQATLHHLLYAHNRLRNPRTTGGADDPAALTMFNTVIYNWSANATHTGSERIHLNWLHNFYRPGPDTPATIRTRAFEFMGDPGARVFALGNFIDGSASATSDNRLAIFYDAKFKKTSNADKAAMIVDQPFGGPLPVMQSAHEAYESVLANAGATLPSRDAVDLRIVRDVRLSQGKIISKETDLPKSQRWPDYRSLPPPPDLDGDSLPDFWESQFGLSNDDPNDSTRIAANGYATIEHYFNNTDPRGHSTPIVYVAASVSRATPGEPGEWRISRTGDLSAPLSVHYTLSGDAARGRDYWVPADQVTIPSGESSITVQLSAASSAQNARTVILTLASSPPNYSIGCPSVSLIVLRNESL
jgi:hypothetical protein